jgi:branched-chain amino acid transport system substrate-binding protein
LTGYAASYGEDAQRGAQLAIDEANAAGGYKGEKFKLLVEDTAGAGKSGVAATQKLVNIDKVPVIVGGMMSSVALPASPIARENKVVYISTMSSHPDLTSPGGFIYRLAGSDAQHGVIEADFAIKVLKAKTAVGLIATTDYGKVNSKIVHDTFVKQGGKWLATENFQQGATNFRTQIAKLKEYKPDILFIVATHKEAAQMFRQMVELNFRPQVMGTSFLDDPNIFKLAGDAANGVYFTTGANETTSATQKARAEFDTAFKAKYHKAPGITAKYFYDGVRLAVDAVKAVGTSGPAINAWIAKVKSFPGVTAPISFTPIGDSMIPVEIKQIKNGKFVDTGFTERPQ